MKLKYIILTFAILCCGVTVAEEISVWDTNYNELTLVQNGEAITGSYTYDGGEITGVLSKTSDGRLLITGWWKEDNNAKECGPDNTWSGSMVFLFNSDQAQFTGDWGDCSSSPDSLDPNGSGWNGSLLSGSLSSDFTTSTPGNSICSTENELINYKYIGACGLTSEQNFDLTKDVAVSSVRVWYDTRIGGDSLKINLTGPNNYQLSANTIKGNCDPYQSFWCEGNFAVNEVLKAGHYQLTTNLSATCDDPSGKTTLIVYGCDISGTDNEQNTSYSALNIDTTNVDIFLPAPGFSDAYYHLRRSYQPFGDSSPIDLETSVLQAGVGAVRVTQLKLNDEKYWVDLSINVNREDLPIEVTASGTGEPPIDLPHWNGDFSDIDFTLTTADIYGPPARIRFFDVGIGNRLYDVDFIQGTDALFVFSNIYQKGFFHYLPSKEATEIVIATQSETQPAYTPQAPLDFPNSLFQSPMAIAGTGSDSMQVDYTTGSQIQTMEMQNGFLLGTYSPPNTVNSIVFTKNAQKTPKAWTDHLPTWLHQASQEDLLNNCIDKKTILLTGFKTDNQLSQQLVDMVFTIAGSSALGLSSPTLEKIRTTVADSKDVVLEMMANGKVNKATLGVFISSTILKNATPKEHQQIIEKIWGNDIPSDVQTAANTSGSLAEKDYKLAAQALAQGLASTVLPAYTAAVKTVQQSVKYAKDTLANESFHELYKIYKQNNGNWDDVVNLSVLSTNKFAEQKVREILIAKKKSESDNRHATVTESEISSYLENKMKTLYAQEPLMEKERAKLNRVKEKFMNLSLSQQDVLKSRMYGNSTTCDLFQEYLDYISRIELDLTDSTRNCSESNLKPDKNDIEEEAFFLAKFKLRDAGTALERRAAYQKEKLQWLETASCLNYVDDSLPSSNGGAWQLAEVIPFIYPGENGCYQVSTDISDGSYSRTTSVSSGACNWHYSESITFTGSWTSPPGTLIPGKSYPVNINLTRSNTVDQWGGSDYMYMYMDNAETQCGGVSASNIGINTEQVKVGWRASEPSSSGWSGTFEIPEFGYAGSTTTNKFQIKAGGQGGCIRYIYQWVE